MMIRLIKSPEDFIVLGRPKWKEAPALIKFKNEWYHFAGFSENNQFDFEWIPSYLVEEIKDDLPIL